IFNPDNQGIGEIGIRGDFLFEKFTDGSKSLEDGFYLTGDLGILTEDNQVFVTGRKNDLIIVNGKNIYPQDVEFVVSNIEEIYSGRVDFFRVFNDNIGSEELLVIAESDSN